MKLSKEADLTTRASVLDMTRYVTADPGSGGLFTPVEKEQPC